MRSGRDVMESPKILPVMSSAAATDATTPVLPEAHPVHGEGGVYSAGDFLPIEDCHRLREASCSAQDCAVCLKHTLPPRASAEGVYDVVIVGAGCVGSCVARELAKTTARVLVIDRADDVTQGATKGNSGIVHTGYDDKPGTNRARFCWPGNQMFAQLDKELNFGYQRNGSLVVATNAEEMAILADLLERGRINQVQDLRIVDQRELRQLEPHIAPEAVGALWSPHTGTVTPYEFTIAVAENAASNGVDFRLNTAVEAIGGSKGAFELHLRTTAATAVSSTAGTRRGWVTRQAVGLALVGLSLAIAVPAMTGAAAVTKLAVASTLAGVGVYLAWRCGGGGAGGGNIAAHARIGECSSSETVVRAKFIVNAAGNASDAVSALVGDTSFVIAPRMGEYLLLHKNQGALVRRVLFPTPTKMGKGIVIQPTLWGNVLLGPTARDVHDPEHMAQSKEDIAVELISKCRKLIPDFDAGQIIHSFAGTRAKSSRGDWVIEESAVAAGFVQAAGIDSPGLAGSPAIAQHVVHLLRAAGLDVMPNAHFHAHRAPIIRPKRGWKSLAIDAADARCNVVCKCERVTESEIVDAIHRSLPVSSTQAVRKRTRAGMGHCQGEFCEPRVAVIIARELHVPVAAVVRRPWPASSLLPRRWLTDADKAHYKAL